MSVSHHLRVRSCAPLRLGIAGGGTDLSPYCDIYGGLVINATVNLFAHTTLDLTDADDIVFNATDLDVTEIHPVASELPVDGTLSIHAAVYNKMVAHFLDGVAQPLRISTYCDVPAGSGLGSSSTIVVSIIKAFVEAYNLPLGDYEIAQLAFEIERIDLGLAGGKQDQFAAAFGGLNAMEFIDKNRVIVNPLPVKNWVKSELEASLVLVFTGTSRDSATIIDDQVKNVEQQEKSRLEAMHDIKGLAEKLKADLLSGDIRKVADHLHQSWEAKKRASNKITNQDLDDLYEFARANGALGGKISGAGGGGFMFLIVAPEKRHSLMKAIGQNERVQCFHATFESAGCRAWRV